MEYKFQPCIPEIRKLHIAAENMSNKFLNPFDLTNAQSIAIFILLENQEKGREPMNQRNLETLMSMSNPAVAGVISRLEAKGFVQRIKKGEDKRFNYIIPTEKSITFREQLYPYITESENILFHGFTDDERILFTQFIERMIKNISDN